MARQYRADAQQRSRRVSDRELRMAAKSPPPTPFGIRRRLTYESSQPILQTVQVLIKDGMLPETIIPRNSLHVTEMPKTNIEKQLGRGIVIGYEFGRKRVAVKNSLKEDFSDQLVVSLGSAAIFKQGNLGYRVHSEELELEYYHVRKMMGRTGLKGTMRDVEPLHITCGDSRKHLRKLDLYQAIDTMNEVLQGGMEEKASGEIMYIPKEVTLDPIEFYPDNF